MNSKDVWFDSYEEEYFRSRQKYNNMVAMMVGMDAEISSSHAVADYVILCYRVMMLFYLRTLKKKKALNEKIIHRQKSGRPMQVNGAFHNIEKSCVINKYIYLFIYNRRRPPDLFEATRMVD